MNPPGRVCVLIRELSEARAARLLWQLSGPNDRGGWAYVVIPVNRDLVSQAVLDSILPRDEFTRLPDPPLRNAGYRCVKFRNKLSGPDEPVVPELNFYKVARCVGRPTPALPGCIPISEESETRIVVSNLKLRTSDDRGCFDQFLEAARETGLPFTVVPRHVLGSSLVSTLSLPPNVLLDNRSGILLDHLRTSLLTIHGNCITFDDSEHNPYESTFRANAFLNRDHCQRPEYGWVYRRSELVHDWAFGAELDRDLLERFIFDDSLEAKQVRKDANLEENRVNVLDALHLALSVA